jgi:septum formation protein
VNTATHRAYPRFRRVPIDTLDLPTAPPARPLVLASRSPRRRLLLEQAGVAAEIDPPPLDDADLRPGAGTPRGWVLALAHLKSRAAAECSSLGGERLILAADTIVAKGDAIIGQPRDATEAAQIVRTLRTGRHCVLTGVSLLDLATGAQDLFFDEALVEVGEIDDRTIEQYVESGDWRGKAGAYNLTERLAAGWPIRVSGDPATVMGLPISRLLPRLTRLGVPIRVPAPSPPDASPEPAEEPQRSEGGERS